MLHLVFQLDADRFVLPARAVHEVLPLVTLRALPGARAGLVGLINYRGQAVPVLDVALVMLGRPSVRRVSTRLWIVDHPAAPGQRLALMVERATAMVAKEPGEFSPAGGPLAGAACLGPVAPDAGGMLQQLIVTGLLPAPDAGAPAVATPPVA
jgi:chemotaxis-related protein WspB